MDSWKQRLERRALVIANGDKEKLAKLREIISRFSTESNLKKAAGCAYRRLTEAEDWRLTPSGEPVRALRMLLWVMEEAESDDPMQAMKWIAFRSCRTVPADPPGFVVGVVMGLPAPAPVASRAAVVERRPDLGRAEGRRGMKLGTKKKI
ncbi:uncharacterized protein [Aegilops tauschii subsp. strangulata]|uniref:uncharacterized protein n=1 Tax=Aegilops tauschii subsp. strangulata TaxID=200361 RepID=UPI001E1CA160|nr:uncharacterized protein LOC120968287 [Aegilops tauschii subsp. strangulata]